MAKGESDFIYEHMEPGNGRGRNRDGRVTNASVLTSCEEWPWQLLNDSPKSGIWVQAFRDKLEEQFAGNIPMFLLLLPLCGEESNIMSPRLTFDPKIRMCFCGKLLCQGCWPNWGLAQAKPTNGGRLEQA